MKRSYGDLMVSVFAMGDFGRYIIESAMRHFTLYPLDSALPSEEHRTMFSATWAQRWVFQRVISHGRGTEGHDIPEFKNLVRRKDNDGNKWVVLHAWYSWANELASSRMRYSRRREFWSHVYSWLVRPAQRDSVVAYLEQRTFMNRWMPEGIEQTDAAYLGELPWAISRDAPECIWRPVQNRWGEEPTDLEVSPAWEEYVWEGNILDCSIDDVVRAWYPAPIIFDTGTLTCCQARESGET